MSLCKIYANFAVEMITTTVSGVSRHSKEDIPRDSGAIMLGQQLIFYKMPATCNQVVETLSFKGTASLFFICLIRPQPMLASAQGS